MSTHDLFAADLDDRQTARPLRIPGKPRALARAIAAVMLAGLGVPATAELRTSGPELMPSPDVRISTVDYATGVDTTKDTVNPTERGYIAKDFGKESDQARRSLDLLIPWIEATIKQLEQRALSVESRKHLQYVIDATARIKGYMGDIYETAEIIQNDTNTDGWLAVPTEPRNRYKRFASRLHDLAYQDLSDVQVYLAKIDKALLETSLGDEGEPVRVHILRVRHAAADRACVSLENRVYERSSMSCVPTSLKIELQFPSQ